MTIANNNVIAKIAAVVAGLGLVAMSFAYAAPAAKADTTSDLQAQISALMAQIAALQASAGGSASAGASVTFSKDLTLGSSGADVTALQNWLISKGHTIAAGATGYFGAQTKAALAAWQAANGVTPASGYFGPITRAKVNAMGGSTGGSTGGTDTSGLQGGEGSLDNFGTLGDVESSVDEGDEDVKILGVEFDANDADVMVERVDVDFFNKSTLSGSSSHLDSYIDSVSLWMGGKKIATQDVSKASEDDSNVYSFRFTGLKGIVREDDTAELYVSVDAVSNLDGDDETVTWDVRIPADGIRAVDGAGISETYDSSALTETAIDFGQMTAGDLDITEGDANPEASVVTIDDVNDTNGVTVLAFDLEAKNQDVIINDLPVGLVITGEDAGVDGPVKRVVLKADGKTLDTVSITSTSALTYQALFEDLDYTIAEDKTVEFTVEVDLNDSDVSTFATGTTLYATTTGSTAAWDVEDAEGDDVTVGGSLTGETMTFYEDSISATLVSVAKSKSFSADASGEKDIGHYDIVFKIKALGADMYIDRTVTSDPDRNGSGTTGTGFQWATTSDSTTGTTTVSATISAADTETADTTGVYKINEGDERTFTLAVELEAGIDGSAAVQLTGINWSTDAAPTTGFYTTNLDDFKTTLQTLLVI